MRRRALSSVLGLVAVCLMLTAPGARATGWRLVDGKPDATLAGTTEIDWTGAKGVLLQAPGAIPAPQSAFRLYVTGGTYAFVRFMSATSCAGYTRCDWNALTLEPTNAALVRHQGTPDGQAFIYIGTDPAEFWPGLNEFYLFTDGHAKLVFTTSKLRGRLRVNAKRHITGEVKRLNRSCGPSQGCSPETAVGETTSGGAVHDFGESLGNSEYVVVSAESGDGSTASQDVSRVDNSDDPVGCMYPSRADPFASPDPALHPDGCDLTPVSVDTARPTAVDPDAPGAWLNENQTYWLCAGFYECFEQEFQLDQTGKNYVGFRATRISPDPGTSTGWAIWYSYGIR